MKRNYFLLILAAFFHLLFFATAFSQLLTNNQVVTVTNGVQVTVKGDLQNNAGSSITNFGTIDLSGNWTHHAANNCFGISQGTVILNGSSQNIGGTNPTSFNNLFLQGTGTKTLLTDITTGGANAAPAGILNVGNVVLDLNSKTLNISNTSTGAITFGTGYILSEDVDNSSKVNWTINGATGVHTIPFGNAAGVQIPFSYNLASGNAGDLKVSSYPTAVNNTPYPVTPNLVTHVRNNAGVDNSANTVDRFWEVDVTGNPAASLTFTYAPTENAVNGNANVRGQRWNSAPLGWDLPLPGQINPTSQSVFVPNVTGYGVWALALQSSPLPIELLVFTASPVDNKEVLCSWMTASEINNDFFTVEKSRDGIDFESAGTVDGAGNSTVTREYSFTDRKPFDGLSYYRLRQTDFDGKFSYSQVIAVKLFQNAFGIFIYPNPSNGVFTVSVAGNADTPSELSIYDMEGRLVLAGSLTKTSMQIDIRDFGKGVYMLRSSADGLKKNFRIVVQ